MQVFIHLAKLTTLIDWICNSITIVYCIYLAKMLRMVRLQNKKCSETGPKRCYSGPESTSTCSGTTSRLKIMKIVNMSKNSARAEMAAY